VLELARSLLGPVELCHRLRPALHCRPQKSYNLVVHNSFLREAPVRIGDRDDFARVAATLRESSFDEKTICETFNLKDMSDLGKIEAENISKDAGSDQFRLLARLFLSLSLVARTEVEKGFAPDVLRSFQNLGLLGIGEFGHDEFYARALLYPVAGFLVASDRHSMPDSSNFHPAPDIVFPAIYHGTLQFLRLLPRSLRARALDLCGGAGVGALVLSRHSKKAISADITERATNFSLFNRALNNCDNVDVRCGDLYDAVSGETFDCITAHPPYVPSVGVNTIWRDGGETGELVIKKIVEGLPRFLDPGGIFCSVTQGLDTESGNFEHRVRGWLGEHADEFDILFATGEERTFDEACAVLSRRLDSPEAVEAIKAGLQGAGVIRLPHGVLSIRRAVDSRLRKAWTSRRKMTDETDGADLEAAFTLHDRLSAPDLYATLPLASPRLAPRLQVTVTHVVQDNSLLPADFLYEIDKPFLTPVRFEPWMALLLARFQGKSTVKELYDQALAKEDVPEGFKIEHFVNLVARALEAGYLVLD